MDEQTVPRFPRSTVDQVCIVVDDIVKTAARYWQVFGIGPWQIYQHGPESFREATYLGQPARFGMKVALAAMDNMVYELIEPVEGPSIYTDFLAKHGPGVQHLGFQVADCDEAVALVKQEGYEVVMSGRGYGVNGEGAFAYMGTDRDLFTVFELIQAPAVRRPPIATYPATR